MSSRTQRRSRRRLSAPERRVLIRDAALDVFAERGFGQASIDAIAKRAGISKALIYEHFPSKEALQASLLETEVTELFRRLAAATAAAGPGKDRLRAGIDGFMSFVEERRDAWRLLFRANSDAELVAYREQARAQVAGMVADLIAAEPVARRQADTPEARRAVEAIAEQLVGAMQGLANWWAEHEEVDRAWVVERAMEFAWGGLQRLAEHAQR